jgi:NAD(P)-dependent dehydrogenase (short-subunit alcohol dehydrogenase family)
MLDADPSANGRVCLITGAGRGIGRVLARRYAAAGYSVAVSGRTTETLVETAELVRSGDGVCEVVPADIRVESACRSLVADVLDRFGRLDVLVNNAAVPGIDQPVAEMELANWNDTIATNVTGPMLMSREALAQHMLPNRSGNIQFVSSAAAKSVRPAKAHYAVAKLGLLPLARTLAHEVGEHGIRVNTMVLGAVTGDLLEGWLDRMAAENGADRAELLASLGKDAALRRLVDPHEVADVSLWLASDAATSITGQDLNVTAGSEMR